MDIPDQKVTSQDYQYILTSQRELYRHLQSQAQRIFRTLLASVAIMVAFAGSNAFPIVVDFINSLSIPDTVVTTAGGQVKLGSDFFRLTARYYVISGASLMILSISLLFDCSIQSFRVLRRDPVQPSTSPDNADKFYTRNKIGRYQTWVKQNRSILDQMSQNLRNSYSRVVEFSVMLILSSSLFIGVLTGSGDFLTLIGILIVGIPSLLIFTFLIPFPLYYLIYLGKTLEELKENYLSRLDNISRRSPSVVTSYILFATYLPAAFFAGVGAYFWIIAVWIPQIQYEFPFL